MCEFFKTAFKHVTAQGLLAGEDGDGLVRIQGRWKGHGP